MDRIEFLELPEDVREALKTTAVDKGPAGWDEEYGWGRINAYAALQWTSGPVDNPPSVNITAPTDGDTVSGIITITADASDLYPEIGNPVTIDDKYTVFRVLEASDDSDAEDADIQNAAIWVGLLVNSPADGTAGGSTDRDAACVITGEKGPYLNGIPESAMAGNTYNGPATGGSYCWVVGQDGKVYGVSQVTWTVDPDGAGPMAAGTYWCVGFNGTYP